MSLANIINKIMTKYTPNTKKVARFIKDKDLAQNHFQFSCFQLEEFLPLGKPNSVVIGYMSELAYEKAKEIKEVILELLPDCKIFFLPVVRKDSQIEIQFAYEVADGEMVPHYPGVSQTMLALPDLGLLLDESLTVLSYRPTYLPKESTFKYGGVSEERKAELRNLDLDVEYPTEKMFVVRELCGKDVTRIVVLHDGDARNWRMDSALSFVQRRILICNNEITVVIKRFEDLSYQSPSSQLSQLLTDASWVVNVTEKETLIHQVVDGVMDPVDRGFLFLD